MAINPLITLDPRSPAPPHPRAEYFSRLFKQPQGCVIIFLSNFLALLIKMDAAGEHNRSALGALLVAVNVLLIIAVLFTSWFTTQQTVDDSRGIVLR